MVKKSCLTIEHIEGVNPLTNELLHSYRNIAKAIMEYLGFHDCEDSMILNFNFGTFPNGSFGKVKLPNYFYFHIVMCNTFLR